MTRARKADPEALRKAYVFSSDPDISYTKVAAQFGLARSGVAAMGVRDGWYDQRQQFLGQVSEKTMDALSTDWATAEKNYRNRLLEVAVQSVERYAEQLDDPDFRVSTKDALLWVALERQLLEDSRMARIPESYDPADQVTLTPDQFREIYETAKNLVGEVEEEVTDAPIPLLRARTG